MWERILLQSRNLGLPIIGDKSLQYTVRQGRIQGSAGTSTSRPVPQNSIQYFKSICLFLIPYYSSCILVSSFLVCFFSQFSIHCLTVYSPQTLARAWTSLFIHQAFSIFLFLKYWLTYSNIFMIKLKIIMGHLKLQCKSFLVSSFWSGR